MDAELILNIALRIGITLLGLVVIAYTINSAVGQFVLPRSAPDPLTRFVFRRVRQSFNFILWIRRAQSYEARDRILAFYAPYSLLALPCTWLAIILLGYMLIYRAWFLDTWTEAFKLSGSSLLTLGFAISDSIPAEMIIFSEAVIGLIMVALLIAYLPTMYSAFSRREASVAMLEVRAGAPPSAMEMISRMQRLGRLDRLTEVFIEWETLFSEIEETHTSLAALNFYRSPSSDRSWVTASGAVLDAASLRASLLDLPRDLQAELCIRAGYLALRKIADFFRIQYDPNPAPTDAISVTRGEWEQVVEEFRLAGVPLKPDLDQAWRDFNGWRINYDTVLLAMAALTMAPYAPWSSDRSFLRIRSRKRAFKGGSM